MNTSLSRELLRMIEKDQGMRARIEFDPEYWDESVDALNTARMKEIVAAIGWPTVSKVGAEAMRAAGLLVRHSDKDVEFQEHCLWLIKQEPQHEISLWDLAHLEDRVRVNLKLPQVYGTQYRPIKGIETPCPIEDPVNVDSRRESMGLDKLDENIARMNPKPNN
jgi:hypothetical protein